MKGYLYIFFQVINRGFPSPFPPVKQLEYIVSKCYKYTSGNCFSKLILINSKEPEKTFLLSRSEKDKMPSPPKSETADLRQSP
ncbi:hypothetical protein HMPREF1870_00034 [Bacteroidales bacterium KA00344]|nr:hypothetical protein HMPREF1870_00034 [Bacteroidales bacterium KA00344]